MKENPAKISIPRWYQDLSIPQMQNVFSLGDIMRADFTERITGRTQRALGEIGVTSTFVKITPEEIKKSSRLTDHDPVKFLCEIYRIVTGKYFTDEEYKKAYDCNERIILSAIAFLTLPETVIELHRRIPMGVTPKFPPKPLPHKIVPRKKEKSPYLDSLFTRPDWLTYKKELYLWRKQREETPIPRAILPSFTESPRVNGVSTRAANSGKVDNGEKKNFESYRHEKIPNDKDYEHENVIPDKAGERVNESQKYKGESRQRQKSNLISRREKKIEQTKKLRKDDGGSRQQRKSNVIFQFDEKNEERNKLPKDKGESRQQGKSNFISQREKKIGQTNELSGGDGNKRGKRDRPNLISQREKKGHEKIGAKHSLSVGKRESGKNPRRKHSVSQRNGKIANIRARNKLSVNDDQDRDKNGDGDPRKNVDDDHSKRTHFERKFDLGGKETHLIVTGVIENDDLTNFPISHETSGIACVTPENSDESFFRALNIAETKKTYPRGRENLSRNWQEWFRNVDEEFMKIEKKANEIIKSVDGTLKLMGPEAICDGCCSCRQTRKARVKYHKTKTPRIVIDSITNDGAGNNYVVGSLAMNSPGPSPSESIAELPEVIDSHDNIIRNKIISGVINEKGVMNYFITGVSREIEHVPRKIVENSSLRKPIRNVPPCGCAIERMINEGSNEITSDDNIPWTKQDEICIGKKYRPRDIGASSCRDYPLDKTCRRNPFKKNIDEQMRVKHREMENFGKDNYPSEKKNMYSLAAFQPCGDEDGMAVCGGPWGAVNVPDEEELARREAEAKLIRESPPCGDKPGRAICGAPFGSRHPIPKKPKKDDNEDDDEEEEPEDEETAGRKKRIIREPRRKAAEEKIEKSLNRDDGCSTVAEKNGPTGGLSETPTGARSMSKSPRSDKRRKSFRNNEKGAKNEHSGIARTKIGSLSSAGIESTRSGSSDIGKGDKKHDEEDEKRRRDESRKLRNHWNRMKIMASKLITSPLIIPEVSPGKCKRDEASIADCCGSKDEPDENTEPKEGPFGWRSLSEQALPAEKALLYLADSTNEPAEMIAVRPGGKSCKCRENRNAKKTLLYNVTGLTGDEKGKRDENISRVIDGLIYITPEPSVRNSEEYLVEYELYESPYEKCARQRKNDNFKYIERYLGPRSLMKKQARGGSTSCRCSSTREEKILDNAETKVIETQLEMRAATKPDEMKKWSEACKDEGLMEFYSRCRDNVPCWLRCVEFSKDGCCTNPRKLRIKKPVCECKYERKIVKRDEEKKNWLNRQKRLRTYEKEPCMGVEGLSRPMQTETKLIVTDVKRISRQNVTGNDEPRYCVAGVTQNRIMAPGECVLGGIGMYTPVTTPEPSKPELPIAKEHRHWSPMNIRGIQGIPGNSIAAQPMQSYETNWRERISSDKTEMRIDVLFQNDRIIEDRSGMRKIVAAEDRAKSLGRGVERGAREKDVVRLSGGKDVPYGGEKDDNHDSGGKDDTRYGRGKEDMDRERAKEQTHRTREKDAQLKIAHSVSRVQQPRGSESLELAHAESAKNTREKDTGHGNNSNVDTKKSTGSIVSREKIDVSHGTKTEVSAKSDLKKLMQAELEKMANEGFLFAKLPACHQMPQLQYWIMYRKGIAFSPEGKKNLMNRSIKIWKSIENEKPKKIKAPPLGEPKKIMKNMSWDQADEVKREVALKRALFYSNLRKSRVLQSRAMWGLMEFGKFPGVSFKRAFFTYQASKESDGFVFKPWENSEKSEES